MRRDNIADRQVIFVDGSVGFSFLATLVALHSTPLSWSYFQTRVASRLASLFMINPVHYRLRRPIEF